MISALEDYLRFSFLKISPPTLAKYKTKLDRIMLDMQEEGSFEGEHSVPVMDTGVLLAFRPWQYSYMGQSRKKNREILMSDVRYPIYF